MDFRGPSREHTVRGLAGAGFCARAARRIRSSRKLPIAILATLVFVAAAGASGPDAPFSRTEEFNVNPNSSILIESFRGSTHVEVWTQPTVRVVAEKKEPGAEPLASNDLVLMGINGDLTVRCQQNGKASRIDLTIYVPPHVHLKLTGGAWPVEVSGAFGSAVVQTTSGDIGYKLPTSDSARVSMHSGKGVVRSTVTLNVDDRVGLRTLVGSVGSGSSPIILESRSGNITLTPTADNYRGALLARGEPRGSGSSSRSSGGIPQQYNQGPGQDTNSIAMPPSQRPGGYSPGGGAPAYDAAGAPLPNAGDTGFAGSGSSGTGSRSGNVNGVPYSKEQSNTSENSMGMRARVIPSDASAGGAGDPRYSDRQQGDQMYQDPNAPNAYGQNGRPQSNSTGSGQQGGGGQSSNGGLPPASYPAGGGGGTSSLGGSAQTGSSSTVGHNGPFPIDKQHTDSRDQDSGLRVRIIPSDATAGGPGDPRYSDRASSEEIYPRQSSKPSPDDEYVVVPRKPTQDSDSQNPNNSGSRPSTYNAQQNNYNAQQPQNQRGNLAYADPDAPPPPVRNRPAPDGAIKLESSVVNLNVSVSDQMGRKLADLKKEDFRIFENGELQNVEFFSPSTAPFNLVLLLDISGSIYDKIEVVKSAALHFLDVVGPDDKVAVLTFTRNVNVLSQLTGDRNLLRKRIRAISKPEGGTAFYEAMWFTLSQILKGTEGQRNAIVVMTDGVDNSLDRFSPAHSRVSYDQLARRLGSSDCIVFPIYLDTEYEEVFERGNSTSEEYAISRNQLAQMSELTGGQTFQAKVPDDLAGIYGQVAAILRTVYSVGYYPTNGARDGTYRQVQVSVDREDATVRARRGYFAQ
jgi:VWFA-related protein